MPFAIYYFAITDYLRKRNNAIQQLYNYSNKVLHLGIPKFRCTWARYSFVANRQYSPFRVVPLGRLVCIATGIDIALIRLFAKIQTFVTEE